MASAPTDIQSILDPLQVPKEAKAAAWDAFHGAQSPEDFQSKFDALPLPKEAKAALWESKFAAGAAAPATANQAPVAETPGAGLLEPVRRIGQVFLGTEERPTAMGEVVYQATSPDYRKYHSAARSPMDAPPILDFSALGLSKALPKGVASGTAQGIEEFASGLTTPSNVLLMGGMGMMKAAPTLQRLASAGFSVDMLTGAYHQNQEFQTAVQRGDTEGAARALVGLTGGAAMGVAAGKHALAKPKAVTRIAPDTPAEAEASKAALATNEDLALARTDPATATKLVTQEIGRRQAAGQWDAELERTPSPEEARARKQAAKVEVPEEGDQDPVRTYQRGNVARELAGKEYEALTPEERRPVDELVDQGYGMREAEQPASAVDSSATQVPEVPQPPERSLPAGDVKSGLSELPAGNGDQAGAVEAKPVDRQPTGQVVYGRETDVRVPGERTKYKSVYAVREAEDVIPSHNPANFEANPEYQHRNDRNYSDPQNAERIIKQAAEFDPSYLINDNPDATNGPPIIDANGNVLGGNSRTMTISRVRSQRPEAIAQYRAQLEKQAKSFGLDPELVRRTKNPVLVRQVAEPNFDAQRAITDFNKVGTAELKVAERAVADSRRISQDTLDHIQERIESQGNDGTLAKALDAGDNRDLMNRLQEDGIITQGEKPKLLNADGSLTADGKGRVARLLIGRLFEDAGQLEGAAPELKQRLERVVAPLARVSGKEGWDIAQDVKDAVRLVEEARSRDVTVDDLVKQGGLFGDAGWSDNAIALAGVLKNDKPTEIARRFRQYAGEADMAANGQGMMFGDPPSPVDSFLEAFVGDRKPTALEKLVDAGEAASKRLQKRLTATASANEFLNPATIRDMALSIAGDVARGTMKLADVGRHLSATYGPKARAVARKVWAEANRIASGMGEKRSSFNSADELIGDLQNRYPGVDIQFFDGKNTESSTLSLIRVPKDQQKQGIGSKIMTEIIDYADRQQRTLTLTPEARTGGPSKSKLEAWYKDQGFVKNGGRNKDFRFSESMIRTPRKTQPVSEARRRTQRGSLTIGTVEPKPQGAPPKPPVEKQTATATAEADPMPVSPSYEKTKGRILEKAGLSEEGRAALATTMQKWEAGNPTRTKITHEEIAENARAADPTLLKDMDRKTAQEMAIKDPALYHSARQLVVTLADQAAKLTEQISSATKGTDTLDLERKRDIAERDMQRLLGITTAVRSQHGRNLAMHRMMVDVAGFDPSYWDGRAKKALGLPAEASLPVETQRELTKIMAEGRDAEAAALDKLREQDAKREQLEEIGAPVPKRKQERDPAKQRKKPEPKPKDTAPPTPEEKKALENDPTVLEKKRELARKMAKLEKTSLLDAISSIRRAGLLTSPRTHIRNTLGNASMQVLEETSRVPGAMLDVGLALFSHERTVQGPSGRAIARASYQAATKGLAEAKQVMKQGASDDQLAQFDMPKELNLGGGRVSRVIEKYANTVFRAMSAEDRIFKQYAIRRSLEEQMSLAKVDTATEAMMAQAIADADFATFNNKNKLASMYSMAKAGASPVVRFAMDMAIPFVRTPANVLARVLDYSGGGLVKAGVAGAKAAIDKSMTPEQQRYISQNFGRGVTGPALIYIGYQLAAAGLATGSYQEDAGKRNVDEAAGRLAGAVKIAGTWQMVSPLSPGGSLITIGATLHREATGPIRDEAKRPGKLAAVIGRTILDHPFLTGAKEISDAINSPAAKGERVAASMAGSFVPTIVSDAASLGDTVRRDARTDGSTLSAMGNAMATRTPGARNTLAERKDILGRTLPQEKTAIVNPGIGATAKEDSDPIIRELVQNKVSLSEPTRAKDETMDQFRQRREILGREIEKQLGREIQTGTYKRLATEEERRGALDKAEGRARRLVAAKLGKKYATATEPERTRILGELK